MYPVNQVIVGGGSDFLPNSIEDLNAQMAQMEAYKKRLESLSTKQVSRTSIWDSIDSEINTLNESQRNKLMKNETYQSINNELQALIQGTLLNMVKPSIESSEQGRTLLNKLLESVKVQKDKIIKESNLEMELFSKFREYSKNNPSLTYEEFLKTYNHD